MDGHRRGCPSRPGAGSTRVPLNRGGEACRRRPRRDRGPRGRARGARSGRHPGRLAALRGDGGHEYQLVFLNAGQLVKDDNVEVGGRRIGSVRKIELTDDNLARDQDRGRGALRPAARGHEGVDPPDLAVGHRQPLRRAGARPGLDEELPDGHARHRLDHRASSTSTSSSTRSTRGRAEPAGRDPGLRHAVRGQGRRRPTRRPSTSTRRCRPRGGWSGSSPRTRASLTRFIVNTADAMSAIAERRNDLSALVGNANATAGAIAAENVALAPRARPAADHAAARQHARS